MNHDFYFDGNPQRICWTIKTDNDLVKQQREHTYLYFEKVSSEQSKYIALHVGIFWGIGTFIIKNNDFVNVMMDSRNMYDSMTKKLKTNDELIDSRIRFIIQLFEQRRLKIQYTFITHENNPASELL